MRTLQGCWACQPNCGHKKTTAKGGLGLQYQGWLVLFFVFLIIGVIQDSASNFLCVFYQ